MTCRVDVCDRSARAREYCASHYEWAWRRDFEEVPTHKIDQKTNGLKTRTLDTSSLTEKQLGWVAGIIDGEGCIYFGENTAVRLQVKMTDEETIKRLHNLLPVGSSLLKENRDPHKTAYQWRCERQHNVKHLLESINDILVTKREEANMAISLLKNRR